MSLINKDTKDIIEKLNQKEIYVSTTTACSLENTPSKSVLAITNDEELAKNTIRISISHLTTKEEIKDFLKVFKKLTKKQG
jgi:cysteine desulfurase